MERFTQFEDCHGVYYNCRSCGEEMVFTQSARTEEISRELGEHQCGRAAA